MVFSPPNETFMQTSKTKFITVNRAAHERANSVPAFNLNAVDIHLLAQCAGSSYRVDARQHSSRRQKADLIEKNFILLLK